MKICGIDPSMNSSGKCIMDLDPKDFSIKSIKFYGYNSVKIRCISEGNVNLTSVGTKYLKSNMFDRQNAAYKIINEDMEDVKHVAFEGYAFGANGKVFNIAEATSVIKQMLYHAGYKIHLIEPNVNKKLATGKGNANKFGMLDAFNAKHQGFELIKCFDGISAITDKKIPAPITDIIDAYWLCQYGNKRI